MTRYEMRIIKLFFIGMLFLVMFISPAGRI